MKLIKGSVYHIQKMSWFMDSVSVAAFNKLFKTQFFISYIEVLKISRIIINIRFYKKNNYHI